MGNIQVSLIVEILGRPQEYIKEALGTVVTQMGAENGVKIIDKKYHEPIPVKESKDLFTTFAEVDLELESLSNYFGILFGYMPSHMEITHPEKLNLQNSDLNELGNSLLQRLHNYDAVVKKMKVERELIQKKLEEIAPDLAQRVNSQKEEAKLKDKKPKKSKSKKKS